MALLMLQATRRHSPRGHDLFLGRYQAHCGALHLSNEELAPQMVCTTGHAKATYQELLWTVVLLGQRAQGHCESIEVV
jgi:hypothetical protein